MRNHTKIYHQHFKITPGDWIGCEICNETAVDIHHINPRGMGGSKTKDVIENLMALCRECHIYFGDKKKYKEVLKLVHQNKLRSHQ